MSIIANNYDKKYKSQMQHFLNNKKHNQKADMFLSKKRIYLKT